MNAFDAGYYCGLTVATLIYVVMAVIDARHQRTPPTQPT